MHLVSLAAVTLVALSTACTIVVQAAPIDDATTTSVGSSTTSSDDSGSSSDALEESSSSGVIDSSTGEDAIDTTSTGDTTSEIIDSTGGDSSSTTGDGSSSTGDDNSSTGITPKEIGELCDAHVECDSGVCHADHCAVACTQEINDCGAQGVPGLCVEVDAELFTCVGDLTFGDDAEDDTKLNVFNEDEYFQRTLQTADDADLFVLDLPMDKYQVDAVPVLDADLQIEIYDGQATLLGVTNKQGMQLPEWVQFDHEGGVVFVVVRSIGTETNDFLFTFMSK